MIRKKMGSLNNLFILYFRHNGSLVENQICKITQTEKVASSNLSEGKKNIFSSVHQSGFVLLIQTR